MSAAKRSSRDGEVLGGWRDVLEVVKRGRERTTPKKLLTDSIQAPERGSDIGRAASRRKGRPTPRP